MAPVAAHSDTELVLAARDGAQGAFAELFERWFDRAYDVARNIVRNDETAAEVAQDTFLVAWQGLARLENPDAFGGWVLRIARNRALNRLERERRSQPLDNDVVTGAHDAGAHDPTGSSRLIETEAISEVRDRQELVWAAAAALGERDASVLDLHLRHGLSPAEIAEELGVTANNAHQLLFRLRNRLGGAVSGYLLWRNGRPRCATLAALVGGGVFDADALKLIDRHVGTCEVCEDQRRRVVDPQRLFAATPLLVAPALLKAKAARALSQAGVPVDPGRGGRPPSSSEGADIRTGSGGSGASPPPVSTMLGSPPVPTRTARSGRRRRLAMALVVLAVLGAVVVLMANRNGERTEVVAAPDSTVAVATTAASATTVAVTSTTVPSTTSTAPSSTTSTVATTTTLPSTTTVPAVPEPTAPSTTAPRPSTTATVAPTTTTLAPTTTLPPTPAPVIVRFSSAAPSGVTLLCADQGSVPRRFLWSTTDATSAVLTIAGVDTAVDANGSRTTCAPSASTVTLTAIGPGGTVQATTAVP